jgi:hypothetical protein
MQEDGDGKMALSLKNINQHDGQDKDPNNIQVVSVHQSAHQLTCRGLAGREATENHGLF